MDWKLIKTIIVLVVLLTIIIALHWKDNGWKSIPYVLIGMVIVCIVGQLLVKWIES